MMLCYTMYTEAEVYMNDNFEGKKFMYTDHKFCNF